MVQRPVKWTPGSIVTLTAETSPSTFAPAFISMTPSARMLPITRPRTKASFTSIAARMSPCSPISSRSQLRTSPSNSPSIRSVPATMSVPRKLEFTPITVLGAGGSSATARGPNLIMASSAVRVSAGSQDAPCLEQSLEILLPGELELDLAALAPGKDRDVGAEPLLEFGLPLGEAVRLCSTRPGVSAPEPPANECLRPSHGKTLAGHVSRRGQLVAGRVEREQCPGMAGGDGST